MVRRRPEAPSTYSNTQTDSIGVLSSGTCSRRRFRRRRFAFFFFRRLECELEDEESLSLDDISPPSRHGRPCPTGPGRSGSPCSAAVSFGGSVNCSTTGSIGESPCSTASWCSPSRRCEGSSCSNTAQAVQRGPSLALCTTCVVDDRSTTVTWGQSFWATRRCVNTSLTSKSLRRLTDRANQSIAG
ncbi:hypothetical protein PI125_g23176 [Phytophthora idaei]|nr:hypothetical protein PI125_g23176 [Phytophthora idaei]